VASGIVMAIFENALNKTDRKAMNICGGHNDANVAV